MNRNLKSLVILIKVISAGIIILVILTIVSAIILNFVLQSIISQEPASLYPGLEILVRFEKFFIPLYILSTCIASFMSGYLLKCWGVETGLRAWQSFIGGFIVGVTIPFLLMVDKSRTIFPLVLFPRKLFVVNELTLFFYCLFMALMGVLGYYIASRTYKQRVLG